MTNDRDYTVKYKVKEMEINNENLALAIKALSECHDQKIIIRNGVKVYEAVF